CCETFGLAASFSSGTPEASMRGWMEGTFMAYRMINSACNAPASFMAWNIDIMSRGVTPREFKAEATFSTVGNSGKATIEPFSSWILVSACFVTVVVPVWLKAFGWETFWVEATLMVTLPCETAQAETRMCEVATMVPVRSLITMRA